MREIKFRAFDNIDKKMYPYAVMGFMGELHVHKNKCHNGEWINIGCGRDDGEVDYDNEIMQYTGLKDKNSNEIYEGDILKVDGYKEGTYERMERIDEVYWMEDEAGFNIDKEDILEYDAYIIGNIYENKELLSN